MGAARSPTLTGGSAGARGTNGVAQGTNAPIGPGGSASVYFATLYGVTKPGESCNHVDARSAD